jgi:putative two-component system response regulator
MNAPNLLATDKRPRLLLVDDDPTNLHVLRQILGEDYRLSFATDGRKALQLAQHQPDLILLDIMMPELDGYAVCRQLKAQADTARIPVIFITALSDGQDEALGFASGAVDYIVKPVRAPVVRARVRNHLSLVKLDELRSTRLQIVQRLGRAAEYRDNETGMHVIRMSHYAKTLAVAAGCTDEWADDLLNAAPMHDVGKIGIPDAILLKNGPLTAEEWTIMRRHPQIGAEIIGEHDSQVLQMAYSIALTHHEKWDGTGYPQGLAGEDVVDALTTERPYKHAWTVDEAMEHIEQQAGAHFDPRLVPLFIGLRPQLEDIRECWKD